MNVRLLAILISLSLFTACKNSFEKIQKSKDYAYKLQKADEFYDRKQFGKANTLYEELLTVYKGTKSFETIYYKYAFTFYNNQDYLAASYHFKNFADLFPKSPKAEECEYLNSVCLYRLSPNHTLDQSNTVKSIGELQAFVNTHPTSKRVKDANKLIDEQRQKLEDKDVYGAELYFKIGQYKASAVSFEQILRTYPDSKNADYYQYMIARSSYKYAQNSIPEKQEERYSRAIADYNEFITKFPKSQYRSEIEKINSLSLQAIKKISKS
ncbi:MAG: outer membrane protein assembly factor BamD [Chitinophagaceae bacterium]|nr:outer membrane protein assembly factor BamD [Chitinophagaceae bacterium]